MIKQNLRMGYYQDSAASILKTTTFKEKLMKRILILLTFMTIGSVTLMAQFPPPPPTTGNNGGTNGFVGGVHGGGAPIGSGVVLLISLAAGYGGKKVFDFRKRKLAE